MTNGDYTQELDALENALALLAERLEMPADGTLSDDAQQLQREIARLKDNQAEAKTALDEATRLMREILANESA